MFFKADFYDPFNSAKLILLLVIDGWLLGHLVNSYRLIPIVKRSNEFNMTILLLGFISSLFISLMQTDVLLVGLMSCSTRTRATTSTGTIT